LARKKKHEEHQNHEAWAIPYGDLITLLLAFFVVMYAISSVNEGKYRVLSDSLVAAFRGTPRTFEAVQVGHKQVGSGADIKMTIVQQQMLEGQPRQMLAPVPLNVEGPTPKGIARSETGQLRGAYEPQDPVARELQRVAEEVERAMKHMVDANLVVVRRHEYWIEVEIQTDFLFPSGVAALQPAALPILQQLADSLQPFTNPLRIEGHTDDRPIRTVTFPSNWELSAARAASVARLLISRGIDPRRLAVVGLAEFQPVRENTTPEGRNANRRVLLVILSGKGEQPPAETSITGPPVADAR
jgi:chemotaxis protein MotB